MPALNNLLAGVKFTIQFAVPEKIKRAGGGKAVPPAVVDIIVRDEDTKKPLEQSFLAIKNLKSGKMSLQGLEVKNGKTTRRFSRGNYELYFSHNDYYPDTAVYESSVPNAKDTLYVYMKHRPVLKVRVSDAETGKTLSSLVKIRHSSLKKPIVLRTTAKTGANDTILQEVPDHYRITIDKKGYEPYSIVLQSLGEDLDIRLSPIKVGRTFVLKNMFFATNKTQILPESEEALQTLYEYLTDEQNVGRRIRIVGHTDNVGKDAANQRLSEGRANAIRNELINRGIEPARIEAEGKGEKEPVDTNDTEEGRANNRRVEIVVLE
ncbi:MAG: OmpA family protein [Paludibacteraceae bacterium]|nr:OmpA family protein [Paludibacteraceae bacterium]